MDLETLDRKLEAALEHLADEPLLASDPVHAYLARRYGLDLRSLVWQPDGDPGEDGWQALDAMLSERPAGWMLWEAEPLASTRARLEARGVAVIAFDVAGNRPTSGDYLSVMRANRAALAAGRDRVP
jgi:zinc transport system substrate-binding protein